MARNGNGNGAPEKDLVLDIVGPDGQWISIPMSSRAVRGGRDPLAAVLDELANILLVPEGVPEEGSPAPVASGDNEEASGAETADTPTTGRVKRKAVKRKGSLDKKKGLESSSDAQCTDPAEPKRTVKVCWLYELLPVELQAVIASYLTPADVLKIFGGRQDYLSVLAYRESMGYRPHAEILDQKLRERVVRVLDLVVEGREPAPIRPWGNQREHLPRGRLSTYVTRDFDPDDPEEFVLISSDLRPHALALSLAPRAPARLISDSPKRIWNRACPSRRCMPASGSTLPAVRRKNATGSRHCCHT